MQITKTTEQKSERSLVPFKEQVKELPEKVGKIFKGTTRRNLIIAASVLVICAAVGINFMLFGPSGNAVATSDKPSPSETPASGTEAGAEATEDDGGFFALAQNDRQRARDEAIETLQLIVVGNDATSEEKTAAAASISRIASCIEKEANIETLVKSKGFAQCVSVIGEDEVSVIVGTDHTLLANELAQIKEIVYLETSMDPSCMRITEKILTTE